MVGSDFFQNVSFIWLQFLATVGSEIRTQNPGHHKRAGTMVFFSGIASMIHVKALLLMLLENPQGALPLTLDLAYYTHILILTQVE